MRNEDSRTPHSWVSVLLVRVSLAILLVITLAGSTHAQESEAYLGNLDVWECQRAQEYSPGRAVPGCTALPQESEVRGLPEPWEGEVKVTIPVTAPESQPERFR